MQLAGTIAAPSHLLITGTNGISETGMVISVDLDYSAFPFACNCW